MYMYMYVHRLYQGLIELPKVARGHATGHSTYVDNEILQVDVTKKIAQINVL